MTCIIARRASRLHRLVWPKRGDLTMEDLLGWAGLIIGFVIFGAMLAKAVGG